MGTICAGTTNPAPFTGLILYPVLPFLFYTPFRTSPPTQCWSYLLQQVSPIKPQRRSLLYLHSHVSAEHAFPGHKPSIGLAIISCYVSNNMYAKSEILAMILEVGVMEINNTYFCVRILHLRIINRYPGGERQNRVRDLFPAPLSKNSNFLHFDAICIL